MAASKYLEWHPSICMEIHRIENSKTSELLYSLMASDVVKPEIFRTKVREIGNYYSWMAIHIKRYLKTELHVTGVVKCTFYLLDSTTNKKEYRASIVINCNTEANIDAPLFQ
jgi:hypothetical protein